MDSQFKGTILYELICCAEWKEEYEEQINGFSLALNSTNALSYVNPANYIWSKSINVSENVKWIKSWGPPWIYALSPNGKIIAVLQSSSIETRSSKDNFSSILGKNTVVKDPHPNFRCLTWNSDSTLFAVSFTNGLISFFDLMASQLFSVRRFSNVHEETISLFSPDNFLSGFLFMNQRTKKTPYHELLCVDAKGRTKCYRQTGADQAVLHHEFSFRRYYSNGVNSVTYSDKHSLILVAGQLDVLGPSKKEENVKQGITIWRILNDHPYYTIVWNFTDNERIHTRSLWKSALASILSPKKADDSIFKLVISPSENIVGAIHISGSISFWQLPSLKLFRYWPLKSQFHYNSENSRFNSGWLVSFNRIHNQHIDHWRFFPFDINWWNDETVIISRVNGCVSLCSLEEDLPNKNLLGDSPEFFMSPVCVSPRFEKEFFAFESEIRYKKEGEGRRDSLIEETKSPLWAKTLIQEFVFWMTDLESFRPPRKTKKKPRVLREFFRLFHLKNITPLDLFFRKIELEEYGEALDLARAYKLDADLVYQRQWTKKPVSINTINDYLGKIKKRNWVLQECLDRIPDDIDSATELLTFGLKGTQLTAVVMISQGKDQGRFLSWSPDDLDISQEDYCILIDPENPEVKRLLSYRKQFLHYLDILKTYEKILGGPLLAEEKFNGKGYAKIRSQSLIDTAIEMARVGEIEHLKIILDNHYLIVASHYLEILSNFSECTRPHDYKQFLPKIDRNGQLFLWATASQRKEKDWCEEFLPKEVENKTVSIGEVEDWFKNRIQEIEFLSGMTSNSLDLARFGIERGFKCLQQIYDDFETLETLVYEVDIPKMNYQKLEKLSDAEKLKLIMSKCDENNISTHFRAFAIPFLNKCESVNPTSKFYLLNEYLTSLSKDNLSTILYIFEESKRSAQEPLISDPKELMQLAYNCIYACESSAENANVVSILSCLDRSYRDEDLTDSALTLEYLINDIERLERHLHVAQKLEKYQYFITLKKVQELGEEEEENIGNFFETVCNSVSKLSPPMKAKDWKSLLYDFIEIHNKNFVNFPAERVDEIYVHALLKSSDAEIINLAADFFEKSPSEGVKDEWDNAAYSNSFKLYLMLIHYEKSIEMILDAAHVYFDSSSSFSDPSMELAKLCLNLTHNLKDPRVSHLFNLIEAVRILNKDFKLNILPQFVRNRVDIIGLIREAMLNIEKGYRKTQQLLKLALLLKMEDGMIDKAETIVLEMVGNEALAADDNNFCVSICQSIMAKEYDRGWNVFIQLAKDQKEPPIFGNDTRISFISYALYICPDNEILNVLNAKYSIERNLLKRGKDEIHSS